MEDEIEEQAILWNKANNVECPYGLSDGTTARARQLEGWNGNPRLGRADPRLRHKVYRCPIRQFGGGYSTLANAPKSAIVIHRRQWPFDRTEIQVELDDCVSDTEVVNYGDDLEAAVGRLLNQVLCNS